jgi:hypothetical protein
VCEMVGEKQIEGISLRGAVHLCTFYSVHENITSSSILRTRWQRNIQSSRVSPFLCTTFYSQRNIARLGLPSGFQDVALTAMNPIPILLTLIHSYSFPLFCFVHALPPQPHPFSNLSSTTSSCSIVNCTV